MVAKVGGESCALAEISGFYRNFIRCGPHCR
jgi:hypothetical protein